MQKHLSAVSQMVAKIIATRADYEVTRQAINRKNPAEDSDWDKKVDALRYARVGGISCFCRCCRCRFAGWWCWLWWISSEAHVSAV